MPATEEVWRNPKRMHLIFAISSLAMLVTTIWMLAADHRREWKGFQRTFRDVEAWSAEARIQQEDNARFKQELENRRAALADARREVPAPELIEKFEETVQRQAKERGADPPNVSRLENAYKELTYVAEKKNDPALVEKQRAQLVRQLEQFVADARFRESNFLTEKKFEAAYFDVDRSQFELGVGNDLPPNQLEKIEDKVQKTKAEVDKKVQRVEQAKAQREELAAVLGEIIGREANASKQLDDQLTGLDQLIKARDDRDYSWSKAIMALPIIDAFGRPLKIDNIWLPKLTINNNFSDVARYDRCTTCHQALDKTAPGSATEPLYRELETLNLTMETFTPPADAEPGKLPTPDEIDQLRTAKIDEHDKLQKDKPHDHDAVDAECLDRWFGLRLADHGLIDARDVTISVVKPESLGAKAGLMVGDVLKQVNNKEIGTPDDVYKYLIDTDVWGGPALLKIQRGLPNPYTTHPRLDLFVGSLSPHKLNDVGCTICHEGQGSATDFKWASHSPNDPVQADKWQEKYGWFDNHHWIFPMNPQRFAESSCLKCHHEVVDLEASERYPDPPAPKLLAGYDLIRQNGCYGCHEINGFDSPTKRIGPDLRTEPNYSAAAQALLATTDLDKEQKSLASTVVQHPDDDRARHALTASLLYPAKEGDDAAGDSPAPPKVAPRVRKLVTVLDDVEMPGKLRKVGPSLRHVADKLDYDFLYSWIRKPKDFRPTTKMPQFFGLWDHLDSPSLAVSKRYEPIEIRGIVAYLLSKSQSFDPIEPARDVETASVERGKMLFETRGCLACHQHADFPQGKMKQGPNLTNLGGKLAREGNPVGKKWLYSWLRDPSNYHPRTLMPNLLLEPLPGEGGKQTDPAADLGAFLLASKDWKPTAVPGRELNEADREALYDLAFDHLRNAYPSRLAKQYLESGIPESMAGDIKGDEVELVGPGSVDKQLIYVGRRTISKYGCSGCHDIPGYEDAKPIGTGLADWGRKSADKLAFEQITQYLMHGHGHAPAGAGSGHDGDALPTTDVDEADPAYVGPQTEAGMSEQVDLDHAESGQHIAFKDMEPSTGFFMKKLFHHEREGFAWQKLRAPRSYDYMKTENKGYNERLRMPQFNLDDVQREQVITFVLGLLAEPPAQQYVARSDPRRKAIVEGSKVIEKFNCKGCHAFQMDRWNLAYAPQEFADPPQFADYAFLSPHSTPMEVAASLKTDTRGLRHSTIVGMQTYDEKTGKPERLDSEGSPLEPDEPAGTPQFARFVLFDNAMINGHIRPSGLQNLMVPMSTVEKQYPTPAQLAEDPAGFGGYLPRLIFAQVLANERAANPNAKPDEVWAWLPPPLVGEGRKVQTNWLHDFLLDPQPIRPAVVLRMPKFNMSSAEASALVAYFAAVDRADYPYDFDPRTRQSYLTTQAEKEDNPHRLPDALKIVTDNNYCVKCHLLGDFSPTGSDRAKGPRLDLVYKRLRPEYTLDWIADPKRILPYTAMPVNIPFDKPVSEALYHGTSLEQVNGVVDLLMNFDRFLEGRTSMKSEIKPAAPGTPQAGGPADSGAQLPRKETLQ